MKTLMIGLLVALVGCTTIDVSQVPFCGDINVTGTNCHNPVDDGLANSMFSEKIEYNYSDAICKNKYLSVTGHQKLEFCFSTWEDNIKEVADEFKKCWNCPEENESELNWPKLNSTLPKTDTLIYPIECETEMQFRGDTDYWWWGDWKEHYTVCYRCKDLNQSLVPSIPAGDWVCPI